MSPNDLTPALAAAYLGQGEKEDLIAQEPRASLFYAERIICGRWIPGEEAISQDPETLCRYAQRVIKGQLPQHLHQKMIMFSFEKPRDQNVRQYFIWLVTRQGT